TEGAALATGADELVHEVLLLRLRAVDDAGAQDERARDPVQQRPLARELAAPVDVERPRPVLFLEPADHAVEHAVRWPMRARCSGASRLSRRASSGCASQWSTWLRPAGQKIQSGFTNITACSTAGSLV